MPHYRKYLRPDPFEGARRAIEGRLLRVQAQLLEKFPAGQPRELMRRTLGQLLDKETDAEGKIRRLIAVVQQYGGGWQPSTEYTDAERRSEEGGTGGMGLSAGGQRERRRGSEMRSSLLDLSQKARRSFEDEARCFLTENEEARSAAGSLGQPPSPSTPFSRLPSYSDEPSAAGNDSAGQQLYQSVNEKDIFSFRTQKEQQSPAPLSRSKLSRSGKGKLSSPSPSPSKSKQSVSCSEKNSRKSKKSALKQSKKITNYDGVSQSYAPSRASPSSKPSRRALPEATSKQLYQKIYNRLKYSSCVVSKVDHSSSTANSFFLENRIKLQQQIRGALTRDIISSVQRSEKWR